MEIGMKEEMGVADKMTLSVLRWGALQLIAQKAHYNTFISSLLWLEAKYCNEKWHEEESGNLTLLLLGHFARNVCNRVCGAPKHTYFCGLTRRAVAVSFLLHEIN